VYDFQTIPPMMYPLSMVAAIIADVASDTVKETYSHIDGHLFHIFTFGSDQIATNLLKGLYHLPPLLYIDNKEKLTLPVRFRV
jgi:hypothetical protein